MDNTSTSPIKWNDLDDILKIRYLMYEELPIYDYYFDGTYNESKFVKKEDFESCINNINNRVEPYEKFQDSHPLEGYGDTSVFLLRALDKYPIKNKTVVNMGNSGGCWFESIIISRKGICSTIEYNKLETDYLNIDFITVEEFKSNPTTFDCAFSISSFEHDGLGRYGDPINPDGDLEAMRHMKSIIKPGGLLYLVIPVGMDSIAWNAHRIYGRKRLPCLFHGWELIDSFGVNDSWLDIDFEGKPHTQPVFILKNI
jgi:SAM-dependent methyltransferase